MFVKILCQCLFDCDSITKVLLQAKNGIFQLSKKMKLIAILRICQRQFYHHWIKNNNVQFISPFLPLYQRSMLKTNSLEVFGLNITQYKCRLRLILNSVNELESLTSNGKQFHIDRPELQKLQEPKGIVLVLCLMRSRRVAERNWWYWLAVKSSAQFSVEYCGSMLCRYLHSVRMIL